MNLFEETFGDYPHKAAKAVGLENINKEILWAAIQYYPFDANGGWDINLKSDRTESEFNSFIEIMKTIDYDDGYGTQEVEGYIVFKDGTWLSRGEYDGSEWWVFNSIPKEPNWDVKEITDKF